MCTQAVNEYQEQGNKDLTFKLLDAPDIFKCLYEFLHESGNFLFRTRKQKKRIFDAFMQVTQKLLQNFDCAAGLFNSSFCLFAHCIDLKADFTFQFAVSKHFYEVSLADQPVYIQVFR